MHSPVLSSLEIGLPGPEENENVEPFIKIIKNFKIFCNNSINPGKVLLVAETARRPGDWVLAYPGITLRLGFFLTISTGTMHSAQCSLKPLIWMQASDL